LVRPWTAPFQTTNKFKARDTFVFSDEEACDEESGLFAGKKMELEFFREYCLAKRGATESTPFGETVVVFKVGGKMFALAALDEVPTTVNLKCDPDRALELRDRYEQVRPGYHMNKKHWNTVELGSGIPNAEIRNMIDQSYDLVVQSLPKRERDRLTKHHRVETR
jgi:predicted DNA-binding protein (MmcQ/YjbR family)